MSPNEAAVSSRIRLQSGVTKSVALFLEPILSVDLASYHWQKRGEGGREGCHVHAYVECSALVMQQMMKLHAFPSIVSFCTLLTSPTVINSMLSSCWFQATKAGMVFFGDPDTLVNTECSEFRAGIWPMRRVFVSTSRCATCGCALCCDMHELYSFSFYRAYFFCSTVGKVFGTYIHVEINFTSAKNIILVECDLIWKKIVTFKLGIFVDSNTAKRG